MPPSGLTASLATPASQPGLLSPGYVAPASPAGRVTVTDRPTRTVHVTVR